MDSMASWSGQRFPPGCAREVPSCRRGIGRSTARAILESGSDAGRFAAFGEPHQAVAQRPVDHRQRARDDRACSWCGRSSGRSPVRHQQLTARLVVTLESYARPDECRVAVRQGSPRRRLSGSLPAWQREIFSRVRDLVHEAYPEVEETIKRTVQPYFVLNGNICAFLAAKDHVNVFLYDPIAPDREGIITAGHDNKTGRQISYRQGAPINERALLATFKSIIANNRAGGWRPGHRVERLRSMTDTLLADTTALLERTPRVV